MKLWRNPRIHALAWGPLLVSGFSGCFGSGFFEFDSDSDHDCNADQCRLTEDCGEEYCCQECSGGE